MSFGKYWRNSPFVFSFVPLCQECPGIPSEILNPRDTGRTRRPTTRRLSTWPGCLWGTSRSSPTGHRPQSVRPDQWAASSVTCRGVATPFVAWRYVPRLAAAEDATNTTGAAAHGHVGVVNTRRYDDPHGLSGALMLQHAGKERFDVRVGAVAAARLVLAGERVRGAELLFRGSRRRPC